MTGTMDQIHGTSIDSGASWPEPGSKGIDTDENPAPVVNPRGTYLKEVRFLKSGCRQKPVPFQQRDQGKPQGFKWNQATSFFVPQDQLWVSQPGNHQERGQCPVGMETEAE